MEIRTRYRASQIIIDKPDPNGETMINIRIQKVDEDMDGNIVNEYMSDEFIHRIVTRVATEIITMDDLVMGDTKTNSVACLSMSIEQLVCNWIMEKHPDTYQEGDLIWEL